MSAAPTLFLDSARDYRREARRLRCNLAKDRAQMLRELAALSQRHDAAAAAKLLPQPSPAVRDFSFGVASALRGGVLRYSVRKGLLNQAGQLGISRFDANLIIAAVEHRTGRGRSGSSAERTDGGLQLQRWVPWIVGLVMQAGIVGGGVWLVHHLS